MNPMLKLYAAYGANTNFANMQQRCPDARYIGNMVLDDHQLKFRGVADVVPLTGSKVEVALWWITSKCEAALDRFEGFPRTYVKKYVTTHLGGKRHRVMLYVMRDVTRVERSPSLAYEHCLRTGYAECALPIAQLDSAMARAAAAYTPEVQANEARRAAVAAQMKPRRPSGPFGKMISAVRRLTANELLDEAAEDDRQQRITDELARIRAANLKANARQACGTCHSLIGHAKNCPDAPQLSLFHTKHR